MRRPVFHNQHRFDRSGTRERRPSERIVAPPPPTLDAPLAVATIEGWLQTARLARHSRKANLWTILNATPG